jgi:predicted metal-dependent hydrolase
MQVSGISVQIVRKDIKNLHLSVLPPSGRVRVSVPTHLTDDRVRAAIATRLPWIRKQQREFSEQPRQSARDMATGESHYFMGKRYRLDVIECNGKHKVVVNGVSKLRMQVQPSTTTENRQKLLNEWYREQLKSRIPDLLSKWETKMGVHAYSWGVKKMKTKWGSCSIKARRVWLNLDLACKPPECLEYILVHELVHLLERNHNDRFRAYMDEFMPNWRLHRETLNRSPLGNQGWEY